MAKINKKIDGPLVEPMRPLIKGIIAQVQNDPYNSYNAKLKLLCEHYDLNSDRSQYSDLAIALAIDHVPGFNYKKKSGAKTKWTMWSRACLVVEIERLRNSKNQSHSIMWAITQLSKSSLWKSLVKSKKTPNHALRQQYYKAKEHFLSKALLSTYKKMEDKNTLDEWDDVVKLLCK